jgi:hypothetical protein
VVWSSRILAYSMLWRPNGWVLHSTPFKRSKDQLEYHSSLYLNNILLWGISTLWSLSHITQKISNEYRSKEVIATHKSESCSSNMHARQERAHESSTTELQLRKVLESLSQWTRCVNVKSRRLRMLKSCLVYCSMRLGVPFIALRQLGAVGAPFGRP